MKKQFVAFALVTLLASCNGGKADQQNNFVSDAKETTKPANERKTIRKQIPIISNFTNIINIGSIDIIYTVGENSLEAEGDSALLNHVQADFDSNLLTVGIAGDDYAEINRFGKTNNVKLYVSCPSLQCISVCGNGGFTQKGQWTSAEEIQVGVLGTGSIVLDKVESPSFRLEATAQGPVSIAQLKTDKAIINSRVATSITANLDTKELYVYNASSPQLTLTGHADNTFFEAAKDKNLKNMLK